MPRFAIRHYAAIGAILTFVALAVTTASSHDADKASCTGRRIEDRQGFRADAAQS